MSIAIGGFVVGVFCGTMFGFTVAAILSTGGDYNDSGNKKWNSPAKKKSASKVRQVPVMRMDDSVGDRTKRV